MMPNVLKVLWKGIIYEVPVCYENNKFKSLIERWPPDGIIPLKDIFITTGIHNTWPNAQERLITVKYVFRKCKEPFDPLTVKGTMKYLAENGGEKEVIEPEIEPDSEDDSENEDDSELDSEDDSEIDTDLESETA